MLGAVSTSGLSQPAPMPPILSGSQQGPLAQTRQKREFPSCAHECKLLGVASCFLESPSEISLPSVAGPHRRDMRQGPWFFVPKVEADFWSALGHVLLKAI